jgi:membrane protein DedA with SNARE-associated domain/rhodanese-related sulfurtransferase
VLFLNALGASLGLPIPAMPTLVMVGASIVMAPVSTLPHLLAALLLAVLGALMGDLFWFHAGRRYGGRTLHTLCKLSLSRDSCVKQTERFFGRWGVRVLFAAKFIPGLSLVSVPVAGAMGVGLGTFVRFDAVGTTLWAAAGLALGALFAHQLDAFFVALNIYGRDAIEIAVVALALYIAYRWWHRRALSQTLESSRVTTAELQTFMEGGLQPVVYDIRSPEKRYLDPVVIPGAQFADERQLDDIIANVDRASKIVIYCTCPNEVSAAWMAKQLRRNGFHDATPLLGGLDAWREEGRELETIAAEPPPGVPGATQPCVASERDERAHDPHPIS